jgi:hypothetical protein
MKKQNLLLSTLFSISLTVFIACNPPVENKAVFLDFDKYVTENNIGKLEHDKIQSLHGKIHINVTKENMIIVWVDDSAQPNNIFYLQQLKNEKINKEIANGKVLVLGNLILVQNLDDNTIHLLKLPDANLPDKFKNVSITTQYEGFALIRSVDVVNYKMLSDKYANLSARSDNSEMIDIEPKARCFNAVNDIGKAEFSNCDAGGAGSISSQCGNNEGSNIVTCFSGYYSCCKY